MKKQPSLEADSVYHIYNHAVDKNNLFRSEENYHYFLKRYLHFLEPIAKTYCYCLMPNHFHIVVHIKKLNELVEYFDTCNKLPSEFKLYGIRKQSNIEHIEYLTSKRFGDFFSGYAQAYNKMYDRRGNLFMYQFNRKKITDRDYFKNLICYIHRNPVHHNFCDDFQAWAFSSYQDIIQTYTSTWLKKDTVLNVFGSLEQFKTAHMKKSDWNYQELELYDEK
jgi:putative transposase